MEQSVSDHIHIEALLRAGDLRALEEAMAIVPGFPQGTDPLVGDHWLGIAVGTGNLASVEWMIDKGAPVDFDDAGYGPLHGALEVEGPVRLDMIDRLVAAGADVNARGVNDWTPLHMAAVNGDVEAVTRLLAHGADTTIRTRIDDCQTAAEEARSLGQPEAAALIEASAVPAARHGPRG